MTETAGILLGLIGDNIAGSRSPLLHQLAGTHSGLSVRYDRLVPPVIGQDFDVVFETCKQQGYRGVNITYPYKERVVAKVEIPDPLVRSIAAVNTVLFEPGGAVGYNTDYTGFIDAYRAARTDGPGIVTLIGTGGVGRAIAFALVTLGAQEVRLVDRDPAKSEALAADLRRAAQTVEIRTFATAHEAAQGAQGLINSTPVGMTGYGGTPLDISAMPGAQWAFDAVYDPVDTTFLADAAASGLSIISGYELFFYQGVRAWDLFAGIPLDEPTLRAALAEHG